MVSSSPPSCSPSSAGVGVEYSKIGSSSSSALRHSSDKLGYCGHGDLHHNKLREFCAGYGGRAIACVIAALSICLLVVLLVQSRHGHKGGESVHKPGPSESPLISPTPSSAPPTERPPPPPPPPASSKALSLSSLCNSTDEPQLCLTTLSAYPSKAPTALLQDLTAYVAGVSLTSVNQTYTLAMNLSKEGIGSSGEKASLQDCLDLLDEARDGVNDSINRLTHLDAHADAKVMKGQVMDVQTWMSSAYTEQSTCLDGFDDVEGPIKEQMLKSGQATAPLMVMVLSFAKTLKEVGLGAGYALHPAPP